MLGNIGTYYEMHYMSISRRDLLQCIGEIRKLLKCIHIYKINLKNIPIE